MQYEKQKEWLATLKEGDKVCVFQSSWGSPHYEVLTIKRMTPTQFVCSKIRFGAEVETKFRKETGYIVGDGYSRIEPITERVIESNKQYHLENWFTGLKVKKLSIECLDAMKVAYDSFENPIKDGK